MGIETAIATAIAAAGASAATAAVVASFIVGAVESLALGALSSLLAPKPKTPNLSGGFSAKAQGLTQNVRQAITDRRIVYGEVRVGGALTFMETSQSNKYLHICLVLADHEVEEIGEIWFNDISIPDDYIDGNGNVINGAYANRVRIKKYLGTTTQLADSDLVAETTVTTDFRGRGIAYLYVRLQFDRDVFPSSIPNITAWVKGKKILDPRDAITRWTANGALMNYDYMTLPVDGLVTGAGVNTNDVDETFLNASSNICDEMVDTVALSDNIDYVDTALNLLEISADKLQFQTGDRVTITTTGTLPLGISAVTNYFVIPYQRITTPRIALATTLENALAGISINITDAGNGTHTIIKNAEPRYYGGGVIETSAEVGNNIKDLLTIMGGDLIYIGGQWKIKAASYSTPIFEFNEDHLLSPVTIRTKSSRRDRFNLIKGVYVSPINDGEPADYPSVTNATYVANDNGRTLPVDFDLPMTQRPHAAMRMAKIKLEKHRQELFFEATFNLHAMQVQYGDVVNITNTRMGWVAKAFEVVKWELIEKDVGGVPLFAVKMSLQETASAVYDWNSGEETVVDPALNTNLPDPFAVSVVGGFSLDSILVDTQSGDKIFNVKASWVAPSEVFVTEGGKFEIEYKETTAIQYSSAGVVDGGVVEMLLPALKPDVLYDVRIFAYNYLNVRSAETIINNFQVGSTITTDTQDWENETLTAEDWV